MLKESEEEAASSLRHVVSTLPPYVACLVFLYGFDDRVGSDNEAVLVVAVVWVYAGTVWM